MRKISLAAAGILAVAVSACQSTVYESRPIASAPTGVEGTWADLEGVAVSTLIAGVFESVANDTGERLSQGSYTYRDRNTIDLTINSIIRGTTTNATCALVTPSQLNCTNSDGIRFVLVRQTAAG